MATFTSTQAASTKQVYGPTGAGQLLVRYGVVAVAANPVANDIYQFCRVPAGAIVIGGKFYSGDLDTNAAETLDLDLGWEANGDEVADPDGFGNYGVMGTDTVAGIKAENGYLFNFGGVLITAGPKLFVRETIISATCIATAATFAAGTMSVVVYYTVG